MGDSPQNYFQIHIVRQKLFLFRYNFYAKPVGRGKINIVGLKNGRE